jgi:hypothetical protein
MSGRGASDAYRSTSATTIRRARGSFGLEERLVLELPLSADELLARLGEIVEETPDGKRIHRFSKPLTGDLKARELRLVGTQRWIPRVVVTGSIVAREGGSTATLVISLDPSGTAAALMVLLMMVFSGFFRGGERVIGLGAGLIALVVIAYGVRRTARYGIDDTRRLLTTALDPDRAVDDVARLEPWKGTSGPPDPDALMKRLEDWERRNVK